MTFYERVARLHARGESVPSIVVEEGETVEEVRAREGIRQAMITQQDRMAVVSKRPMQSLIAAVSRYYPALTPLKIFF